MPDVYSELATKGDLRELRNELRGEMAEFRGQLRGEMAELRGEMVALRGEMAELRGEMAELRTELSADLARHVNSALEAARDWFRTYDDQCRARNDQVQQALAEHRADAGAHRRRRATR